MAALEVAQMVFVLILSAYTLFLKGIYKKQTFVNYIIYEPWSL